MHANQEYAYDFPSNTRNNSGFSTKSFPYYSTNQSNNDYVQSKSNRYSSTNKPVRSNSHGATSGGAIEKTNTMSSENPFYDPARPYEQYNTPRSITSIVSPRKSNGAINKSLNLSNENPFHAVYGVYQYPSHIDPSKRITNQSSTIRSTENKSLNLSDENPFHTNYGRYQYPSQVDQQKRITDVPKSSGPLIPTNNLSNNNSFNTYRPSLIREYSNGGGSGLSSLSTSIADWTRNNPAPLSYRPIQIQKSSSDIFSQKSSPYVPPSSSPRQQRQSSPYIPPSNSPRQQRQSSPYVPPSNSPRQQRQSSPILPLPTSRMQPQKSHSSAPLDKTSLNMSPDNPFADAYGRYYYPSTDEIKAQKRAGERQPSINDIRSTQSANPISEYPSNEKKDPDSGKGNSKFARFDVN